jgi:hypothetical protein
MDDFANFACLAWFRKFHFTVSVRNQDVLERAHACRARPPAMIRPRRSPVIFTGRFWVITEGSDAEHRRA